MAIVVSPIGTVSAAAGATTLALTTTADAPAASLILVAATGGAGPNLTGCVDSAGNGYAAGVQFSNGTGKQRFFYGVASTDLPVGGTITVTWATTNGVKMIAAVSVAGLAVRDLQGAGASGTSTTPSIATGTLGWPNEIVFGLTQVTGGAADAFTEASGFMSLAAVLSTDALRWAYQIVGATSPVTYAPTLGASRLWGVNTLSFAGAAASPFNKASRFTYLEI